MSAQLDTEFREFMHGRWAAMVRLAYALTGDQGHAEDVAQAAFARAYASWPKVRRTGNPEAYVRRIVVNENRNRFRKQLASDRTEPVSFIALSGGTNQAQFGAVGPDVSYVTVRLGNGTLLTLHPAMVWGVREVAFAAPVGAGIAEATAYSRHGVIATAIPFSQPGEMATFSAWLRPGQHGLSRASGRIASGVVSGHAWSVTAYLGPWGICVDSSAGGGYCTTTASGLGTSLLFRAMGTPGVAGGTASAAVTRVVAYPPGGAAVQTRPVTVGGQKFFAFPLAHGDKAVRWKAYDSAGNVVASGTT